MRIRTTTLIACSLLVLAACGKGSGTVSVDTNEKQIGSEVVKMVMKSGKTLVDPVHGKEVAFWYGAVSGVEGTPANGVAYTHKFEDGTYVHTLNLNIKPTEERGKVFVSWLMSTDSTKPAVKVGELSSVLGDARHAVKYETKADLTTYTKVVVTLESTVNPTKPGKHVAEGDVKAVAQ